MCLRLAGERQGATHCSRNVCCLKTFFLDARRVALSQAVLGWALLASLQRSSLNVCALEMFSRERSRREAARRTNLASCRLHAEGVPGVRREGSRGREKGKRTYFPSLSWRVASTPQHSGQFYLRVIPSVSHSDGQDDTAACLASASDSPSAVWLQGLGSGCCWPH